MYLAKAFDTVDHDILLKKLHNYGIRGVILNLLKSYLENRVQCVIFDNQISGLCKVTHGVPQGSILGPLLFLVYVDDMKNCSSIFNFILFADDTNLFVTGKSVEIVINLANVELTKLSAWFKVNKLSLNVGKTNFMLFKAHGCPVVLPPHLAVKIDGKSIEGVGKAKFLGVIIDENLNWKSHISFITNIVARNVGVIGRVRHKINANTTLLLYDTMVHSHLSYCNIIWASASKSNLSKLHRLQKRALRLISLSPRLTPSAPLFYKRSRLNIFDIHLLQLSTFVYIVCNNTCANAFSNYFVVNNAVHCYNTRSSMDLHHAFSRTGFRARSIKIQGPQYWNTIPPGIRNSSSVHIFKKTLKAFFLSAYTLNDQQHNF